ncbi:hypothetical protein XELAEV_18044675mg [Xenopus laevis]|uniref:Uncharacterized protein n=1 Tax=Xenopus laevis TaxID=8355 RepID=A0A974BZ89_XENLA|nr:hypothetical protein XELAEV_18044675mg [Xenopus laevis]
MLLWGSPRVNLGDFKIKGLLIQKGNTSGHVLPYVCFLGLVWRSRLECLPYIYSRNLKPCSSISAQAPVETFSYKIIWHHRTLSSYEDSIQYIKEYV